MLAYRYFRCIQLRSYHTNALRTNQSINQSIEPSRFDASVLSDPTWSVANLLEKQANIHSTPLVTEELIKKLGSLCYLSIPTTNQSTDQSSINMTSMRDSVESMIGWMSTINHIDCDGVEAIYTPLQIMDECMSVSIDQSTGQSTNQSFVLNRLREDLVDTSTHINITELAPHTDRGFIVVPKVVDIDE